MDRATQGLVRGAYGWVAFTSPHTVRAVRDRFEDIGLDARVVAGVKIASVAGPTLEALQEWGIEPDLTPDEDAQPGVEGLAESWAAYDDIVDPVRGVLVLNAEVPTEPLVESLTKGGWDVDEVVAYRTVRAAPPPEAVRDGIKRGRYDAVLFSSSSTVRNLVGIAGKPHATTVIICAGPNTARTAEEHGLRVAAIADRADGRALVDALADVAREMHREAESEGVELVRPSDRVRRRKRYRVVFPFVSGPHQALVRPTFYCMTFAARPTSRCAPPRGAPTSPRAHFAGVQQKRDIRNIAARGCPSSRHARRPRHRAPIPPHGADFKKSDGRSSGGDDKRPSSDTEEICAAGGHGTGLRRIAARGRKTQAFGLSCTSSSILTLSLTIIPPASSATFHVRPKSLRLISVLASRPRAGIPDGLTVTPMNSPDKVTGRVSPCRVRSPSISISSPSARTAVDLKVHTGHFSTSKKSAEGRYSRRINGNTNDLARQSYGTGVTVQGQVAINFNVITVGAHGGRLNGPHRELLDIEEISGAQVLVATLIAGVHRGRLNFGFNG